MEEPGEGGAPDLRAYGRTIWRHRWLMAVTAAVAVAVAVGFSLLQEPVYEGTTDLIIQASATQQILSASRENAQDAARNVETETAVLRSKVVQDAAMKRLGHEPDVSIRSNATSDLVSVSARSTNARRAAKDANGYAAAYVTFRQSKTIDDLLQAGEQIQAKITEIDARLPLLGGVELSSAQQQRAFLQQQLDEVQVTANLNDVGGTGVLAKADVPESPVSPKPTRNGAIAFVLGLLLGIGLAFLREHLDDTVATREELERATSELPVLSQVPRVRGWRERDRPAVVSIDAPHSPAAEAYRTLRTSIQFLGVDHEFNSLQLTSSRSNDGKTTTLANLGVAFARAGRKVIVICCDFRRPRIHEFFGLANDVGFTSLLLGDTSLASALQPVPGEPNLAVLSAGPTPPNPSELLSSARAREVVASIEKTFDLVLVDSPPVLPVSDALIVSSMVDATILIASAKSSSRRALRRSVQVLRQVDARLVGTVLNNAESTESYGDYEFVTANSGPVAANGNDGRRGRKASKKNRARR